MLKDIAKSIVVLGETLDINEKIIRQQLILIKRSDKNISENNKMIGLINKNIQVLDKRMKALEDLSTVIPNVMTNDLYHAEGCDGRAGKIVGRCINCGRKVK